MKISLIFGNKCLLYENILLLSKLKTSFPEVESILILKLKKERPFILYFKVHQKIIKMYVMNFQEYKQLCFVFISRRSQSLAPCLVIWHIILVLPYALKPLTLCLHSLIGVGRAMRSRRHRPCSD